MISSRDLALETRTAQGRSQLSPVAIQNSWLFLADIKGWGLMQGGEAEDRMSSEKHCAARVWQGEEELGTCCLPDIPSWEARAWGAGWAVPLLCVAVPTLWLCFML